MPNVDFSFIGQLEGGSRTTGYVPAAEISRSGVTIATGFDLGQRNESDLRRLGLPGELIDTLRPYLGKQQDSAVDALRDTPLEITEAQAARIDEAVKLSHVESLEYKYWVATGGKTKFTNLPAEAQTVIASVSFQYGVNLDSRAPKFWRAAIARDWSACVVILKNYGDAYPTRRKREAALLERLTP